MGFSQAIVFGHTRDFQSFRNNTNLTASVGSIMAWDNLSRRAYSSGTTATGLAFTNQDFFGTSGFPNLSQFCTGFDAILSPVGNLTTDVSNGMRQLAFGAVFETRVTPFAVGRAIGYGFHPAVELIQSSGTVPATYAQLVTAFGAYNGAGMAYSGYEGRLEPFNLPATVTSADASVSTFLTAATQLFGQRASVALTRPVAEGTGGGNATASYFTAQVFLDML